MLTLDYKMVRVVCPITKMSRVQNLVFGWGWPNHIDSNTKSNFGFTMFWSILLSFLRCDLLLFCIPLLARKICLCLRGSNPDKLLWHSLAPVGYSATLNIYNFGRLAKLKQYLVRRLFDENFDVFRWKALPLSKWVLARRNKWIFAFYHSSDKKVFHLKFHSFSFLILIIIGSVFSLTS